MLFPKSVTISDFHCRQMFASLYHLQVSCQVGYNLLTYLSKTTLFVDPLTLSHVAILAPSDAQTQRKDESRYGLCSPEKREDVKMMYVCKVRYRKEGKGCFELRLPQQGHTGLSTRWRVREREGDRAAALRGHRLSTPAFAGCGWRELHKGALT